jgi:multimeric flavodoxin WrbA
MKNILGVVGSPRRDGNTHVLVSRILEGAEEGGAMGDLLFLSDLDIQECDGCHNCWEGRECSKGDDMNDVYPKIIQSDVIVFGTPVYWYGPTALMKAFIDRFVYFNYPQNRARIRGTSAVVAVPFEEEDPQTAALLIAWFERCLQYLEMNLAATVIVPGVSRKGDILEKEERLREAYELGRRLATCTPPDDTDMKGQKML